MLLIGFAFCADHIAFDECIEAGPVDEAPTTVIPWQLDHCGDDVARVDVVVNGVARKSRVSANALDGQPLRSDVVVWFHAPAS